MAGYSGPVYNRTVTDRTPELIGQGWQGLAGGISDGLKQMGKNMQERADKKEQAATADARFGMWLQHRPDLAKPIEQEFYGANLSKKVGFLHELETLGARQDQQTAQQESNRRFEMGYNLDVTRAGNEAAYQQARIEQDKIEAQQRQENNQWMTREDAPGFLLHPSGAKLDLRDTVENGGTRMARLEGSDLYMPVDKGGAVGTQLYRQKPVAWWDIPGHLGPRQYEPVTDPDKVSGTAKAYLTHTKDGTFAQKDGRIYRYTEPSPENAVPSDRNPVAQSPEWVPVPGLPDGGSGPDSSLFPGGGPSQGNSNILLPEKPAQPGPVQPGQPPKTKPFWQR